MKAARIIARPWLAGLRTWRALAGAPRPGVGFRVLLLHDVPRADWPVFERLLSRLEDRFGLISPDGAGRILAGANVGTGRSPFLLSFDDGFVSNLELARDVLARRGVRALFFVCPGLVDLDPGAQRAAVAEHIFRGKVGADSITPDQRLMSWGELAELRDLGHSIGAHGMTHRSLAGLDGDELEAEVEASGRRISEQLGIEAAWFAYPFGQIGTIDAAAMSAIARRYKYCRSGVRGLNRPGAHRLSMLADHLDLHASEAWQGLVLEGALDFRYRAARHALFAMAHEAGQDTPP